MLLRIAKHMLIGTVVLSIGRATDFAPFLDDREPVRMPLMGLPYALPSVYLQTLFTYCARVPHEASTSEVCWLPPCSCTACSLPFSAG